MNKFIFILTSILVLFGTETIGQNLRTKVYWGNKAKCINQTSIEEILVSDKSKTIIYKSNRIFSDESRGKHYLELFNQKLSLVKQIDIEKPLFKDKINIETVIGLKNKIFILSADRVNFSKEKNIYLHEVNSKNLIFNTQVDPKKQIEIQNVNLDFGLEVIKNEKETFFAVIYNQTAKLSSNDKIGYLLFDGSGNLITDEIINVPYISKHILLENFTLSNSGILSFTGDLYLSNLHSKNFKKKKPNFKAILFLFDKNLTEFEIDDSNKLIDDYKIAFHENDEIYLSGFFCNTGIESINGMFLSKFKMNEMEASSTALFTFPLKMLVNNTKPSNYKKHIRKFEKHGYINFYNYVNKDILISKNGDAFFIAEQQYKTYNDQQLNTMPSNFLVNQQNENIEYFFNDILIGKVKANDKLAFYKKIPKRQTVSENDVNFCSFYYHLNNDKLLLAYNDHKKNFNADFSEKQPLNLRINKNVNSVLCIINNSGKLRYKKYLDSKQSKIYALPFFMKALNEETYMFLSRRNNYQKLAKLILL